MNTSNIVKRCLTIGLSHSHAHQVASLISKSMHSRGAAGIDRVKRLFGAILSYHFCLPEQPYVKLKYGYPADLLFLKGYPIEIQLRLAFAHRFVIFSKATDSQRTKFVSSVLRDAPCSLALSSAQQLVNSGFRSSRLLGAERSSQKPIDLSLWGFDTNVNALTDYLKKQLSRLSTIDWETIPNLKHIVPIPEYLWSRVLPPNSKVDSSVGFINATQEPGGKLRVFAAPHHVLQCALTPLFVALCEMLKQITNDCTFCQERGVDMAIQAMMQGNTIYSVDLSDATNSFPLSLQLGWMTASMLDNEQVKLFERVSKAPWSVSKDLVASGFPEKISWTVGQPLGLRPSFPAFALTHHFLVRGICNRLGLDAETSYTILGDDILIFDEHLYLAYKNTMNSIGCRVSEDKTFVSSSFAEFAGFIIYTTPTCRELTISDSNTLELTKGYIVQSLRAGKFRPASVNGIRNLALLLRRSVASEFPSHLRPLIQVLECLPPQYGGAGILPVDSCPLTQKVMDIMNTLDFNSRSTQSRHERLSIRQEAWSSLTSNYVRSHDNQYSVFRVKLLRVTRGSVDSQSQLVSLTHTLNGGFMRSQRQYMTPETQEFFIRLRDVCKGSVAFNEYAALRARIFFEVSDDCPNYRLFQMIDNLCDEAIGFEAEQDLSLSDDLRAIKRAVRKLGRSVTQA